MAETYDLISAVTVGSGGSSSIEFTSIPSTYKDICLKLHLRTNTAGSRDDIKITLNSDTGSNYSARRLFLIDNTVNSQSSSGTPSDLNIGSVNGNGSTTSVFSNIKFYIPSYAGSTQKSISFDWVAENNDSSTYVLGSSSIGWSGTSAITSFKIESKAGNNFVQHSTAHIYGIKNS